MLPEPVMDPSGRETLEQVLQFKAGILKDRERQRILSMAALLMKVDGKSVADRAVILDAARLALPDVYETVIASIEDPDGFKKLWRDPMVDRQSYLARGIRFDRWSSEKAEPEKPVDTLRAVGLCASPRKYGNTQLLIRQALDGVASGGVETELINIARSELGYCIDCNQCLEKPPTTHCVLPDEFTGRILPALLAADIVIVGFPIYCGRESAPLAAFFDRWHCLVGKGLLKGKRGMLICTWGHPSITHYRSVMERIIDHMEHFGIRMLEAIAVSCLMGVLLGLDEQKKALVSHYPAELEQVFQAGRALAIDNPKWITSYRP